MNSEWKDVADVLRTRGWNKGDWAAEYGEDRADIGAPVCLLGACGVAWHNEPTWFEHMLDDEEVDNFRLTLLAGAVHDLGFLHDAWLDGADMIVQFNDAPDRTVEDVLAVVDSLANRVLNEFA